MIQQNFYIIIAKVYSVKIYSTWIIIWIRIFIQRNALTSNHSQEPASPYSSASQLAKMIVRRGAHPEKGN